MSPAATTTRWCPTAEQLMILEEMYRGGMRTPSATLIQKITAHLSNYGRVQGKNVFYWFQNHKARDRHRLRRKFSKQLHFNPHHHHHLLHCAYPPPPPPPMPSHLLPLQHYTFFNAASFLPHPQAQMSFRGGYRTVDEEEASSVMNNNNGNDQTVEMRRLEQKQADLMMVTITEIPTTRPTKTLELFPLTATYMKEECK